MDSRASVALPNQQVVKRELSADAALEIAWWTWCALLAVPFVVFLAVVWQMMDSDGMVADQKLAQTWFVVSLAFLGLGVPAAFFWRSRFFKGYWEGCCVKPRDYLIGMITIWMTLEIGGIFAMIGCVVTGTLLPNLLPALLAFMLFTPLWPNGHAMTSPLANERDPGGYEEPR